MTWIPIILAFGMRDVPVRVYHIEFDSVRACKRAAGEIRQIPINPQIPKGDNWQGIVVAPRVPLKMICVPKGLSK